MIALGFRRGRIFARLLVRLSVSLVRRCEVVDAFNWGSGDVGFYFIFARITQG